MLNCREKRFYCFFTLPLPYKKSRVCYFFFTIDCCITTWVCAVLYMFIEWKRWSYIAADKSTVTRLNLYSPINSHSATVSLAHHLLHASSWFEWLFVFPFSQPCVSQRHWKYLYAMGGGAPSEEVIETRRDWLKSSAHEACTSQSRGIGVARSTSFKCEIHKIVIVG